MARSKHWVPGEIANLQNGTDNTRGALLYRSIGRGYCPVIPDPNITETLNRPYTRQCDFSEIATIKSSIQSELSLNDDVNVNNFTHITTDASCQQSSASLRIDPSILEEDSRLQSAPGTSDYIASSHSSSSSFDESAMLPMSYWFSEVPVVADTDSSTTEMHETDLTLSSHVILSDTENQLIVDDSGIAQESSTVAVSFSDAETEWPDDEPSFFRFMFCTYGNSPIIITDTESDSDCYSQSQSVL